MHTTRKMLVALAGVSHSVVQCLAEPPRVVFSNISSASSSNVPGETAGWKFTTGATAASAFFSVRTSPDGSRWVMHGAAQQNGGASQDVIVRGAGVSGAGAVRVARVGLNSFFDFTRTYATIDDRPDVNNAGDVAFAGTVSGATSTNGFVAKWNGTGTIVAREGTAVPGRTGLSYGLVLDSARMLSDGTVRFRGAVFVGATSLQAIIDAASLSGATFVTESDVTSPSGQFANPTQTLDAIDYQHHANSASGSDMLYVGDLNGPTSTDDLAVMNGVVIAQESFAVPNSGLSGTLTGFAALSECASVSPENSNWCVLARVASSSVVLSSLGTLADNGEPITPGATETFVEVGGTAFLDAKINSAGNWVVIGNTSEPDSRRNAVLVYNGTRVALREGDAVDIDGDGSADDYFVSNFLSGGLALTDDGRVYTIVSLIDANGTGIGGAVVTFKVGCNDIDFNNDGVFPDLQDLLDFASSFGGGSCPTGNCDSIDFNNDCVTPDLQDLLDFNSVFGGGACPN